METKAQAGLKLWACFHTWYEKFGWKKLFLCRNPAVITDNVEVWRTFASCLTRICQKAEWSSGAIWENWWLMIKGDLGERKFQSAQNTCGGTQSCGKAPHSWRWVARLWRVIPSIALTPAWHLQSVRRDCLPQRRSCGVGIVMKKESIQRMRQYTSCSSTLELFWPRWAFNV